MTIPQEHIDFVKDNLARIVAAENDVGMETKLKTKMDNDIYVGWDQSYLIHLFVVFMKYMILGSNPILDTSCRNFIHYNYIA